MHKSCFATGNDIICIAAQVEFKVVYGPGYQTKIAVFMTNNRLSIRTIRIVFSFYFNFDINVLANI